MAQKTQHGFPGWHLEPLTLVKIWLAVGEAGLGAWLIASRDGGMLANVDLIIGSSIVAICLIQIAAIYFVEYLIAGLGLTIMISPLFFSPSNFLVGINHITTGAVLVILAMIMPAYLARANHDSKPDS